MKDLFIEDMPSHIENWLRQKPFRELTASQQKEVLIYFSAEGYDDMYSLLEDGRHYLSQDIPGLQPHDGLRRHLQTLTAAKRKGSVAESLKALMEEITRALRFPVPAYQVVGAFGLVLMMVVFFNTKKASGPESAERVFVHDTLYIDNAGNGNETLAVADSHNVLMQKGGFQASQAINKAKVSAHNKDQMDTDAIMRGELSPESSHKEATTGKRSKDGAGRIDTFTDDTSLQPFTHPRL